MLKFWQRFKSHWAIAKKHTKAIIPNCLSSKMKTSLLNYSMTTAMRTKKKSTMMKWRSMGSKMMIRALILSFHWIKTWEMMVSNRCVAPTRPMVS